MNGNALSAYTVKELQAIITEATEALARAALREPALILEGDGTTRCPMCMAVDPALHLSQIMLEDRLGDVEDGRAGFGDGLVEILSAVLSCDECHGTVTLPDGIDYF